MPAPQITMSAERLSRGECIPAKVRLEKAPGQSQLIAQHFTHQESFVGDSPVSRDGDTSAQASDAATVSRRDFFVRAGQVGAALTILGPRASWSLGEQPFHAFPWSDGATPADPALYSGLHWRMLGPFRGGRCPAA